MNKIFDILKNDKNFKFIFITPFLCWLILIFFYIFNSNLIKAGDLDGLIKYGRDSYGYIADAKSFLNLDFSEMRTSKLSYIFLITFVLFLKFDLTFIVLLQFITTLISSLCLYSICEKKFSKWVGIICLFFFLTYIPIQLRNFYILTEILFINMSIILTYLFFIKKNQKIIIILISLFILFLRPQGLLIILSLIFISILQKKIVGIYNIFINTFLILSSIFLLIFFINIGINDYELINSLSRGIIWGYSFETGDICKKECISGFSNPNLYDDNLFNFFKYVYDNFFVLLKVSFLKLFLFFSGWRPYYSDLHNIFLISFHLPIYILFLTYFLNFKTLSKLDIFAFTYIVLSMLFISATFVDWSGRFVMYILPFFMIYASKSLSDFLTLVFRILKNRS